MRTSRFLGVSVLAVGLSAGLGGLMGKSALATQDRLPAHYKSFTAALAAIETNYAEPVESDRLVYGAINGMLQTLDPHSSFMDPRTYAQMRERQEQRYYGLGITIQSLDRNITVVRVFEGSPAHQKGLRRGDVIAKAADQDLTGWTTEQAVTKLRGPKGTFVNISLKRGGVDDLLVMDVMRDQVTIPSIPAHFITKRRRRLHPPRGLRRAHRRRARRGARGPARPGHAAPGARPARQPGRPARSGDPRLEPLPAARRPHRLHARPRRQLRRRLPRHAPERVPRPADGGDGQPQQRQRVGDRLGRAAGSRPRDRRRRDDLRQGAGAVGLPRQPGRRPGADHGALLHAERPADPAAVGRRLRRVPHLHDARPVDAAAHAPTS